MSGKNYAHQLDDKNRMRIPAKLHDGLDDGYSITVGTGGCLYVYTKAQADKIKAKLGKLNAFRGKQLKAARFILYNFWDAEEDNQGRIRLPDNLREYAKIKKNVKVLMGPTCIEIWSEEVYNEYFNDVDLEDLADALDVLSSDE